MKRAFSSKFFLSLPHHRSAEWILTASSTRRRMISSSMFIFFIHTYKSKNLPAEGHCQSDCKKARKWQVNYLATRRQLCKRSRLACHVKPLAACKPWHGMKKVEQKDGAGPSRLQNVKDALALKFHTFLRREQDRGICFQSPKHHTTKTQRHNTTTQHLHAPAER